MTIDHPLPAAPEQLEELSAEGLGERRTPGFMRSAILSQPAALVGLGVLFFFVFVAIFGSYLEPYSISRRRPARSTRRPAPPTGWAPTTAAWTCSRC